MQRRRILSFDDLRDQFGIPYTRRHLLNLELAKKFPARVPIGENRVGWIESEVQNWIERKVAEARR
ncbi:helix-turn-helix transcriptional regulator [Bradyrhizobium sp. SEMIA]|uniref:helix-turn-helix transcriptional regulator n=1 Tax=Bradyrhizobium sp. SEMIA TaxID=2597515 RepID=UPI0018A65A54|nr:AlpA family phage regulatory protein [Bradyrhizobium sp. SEMIA]